MSVTRACAHCGNPFVPSANNQRYCSRQCRGRACYQRIKADPERCRRYRDKHNENAKRRYAAHKDDPGWREAYRAYHREWNARKAELARSGPPREMTREQRLRAGALVALGRATAQDMARALRREVPEVLDMRDEFVAARSEEGKA